MASLMARPLVSRTHGQLSLRAQCLLSLRLDDHEKIKGQPRTTVHQRQYSCLSVAIDTGTGTTTLQQQQQHQQQRLYHATQKQEILPLVVVAVVGGMGYYSYRALSRMDSDLEDYQWKLQQYEKQHGSVNQTPSKFPQGTLGVDLGTMHLVMAHRGTTEKSKASIVATREGDRFTYNGILYEGDTNAPPLLGRMAFEKASMGASNQVKMPYEYNNDANADTKVIQDVVTPAVDNALEMSIGAASLQGVRTVVAVPPSNSNDMQEVFATFLPDTTTFVPEPVAAVWGAKASALLDTSSTSTSLDAKQRDGGGHMVVVDVGAKATTCSVVQKNKLLSSITLPNLGAEIWTQTLVEHIVKESSSLPFLKTDEMAQQRLYQAATIAIAEFNTSSQAHIQIPYISMNIETREAQHLDVKVSRSVLEQQVQHKLKETVAIQLEHQKNGDGQRSFSSHVPTPTDYSSLWMSVLIQVLEQINATPMNVEAVLIVGGGSKQPLVVSSLQQTWMALTGNQNADVVLVPELPTRSELVALGAASLSPHYDYNSELGIIS